MALDDVLAIIQREYDRANTLYRSVQMENRPDGQTLKLYGASCVMRSLAAVRKQIVDASGV